VTLAFEPDDTAVRQYSPDGVRARTAHSGLSLPSRSNARAENDSNTSGSGR